MKRALLIVSLLILKSQLVLAGSATWDLNPTSNDWSTAANWTPDTVPNGPLDTATFDVSNVTGVSLMANTEVNSIVFDAGASPFVITVIGQGTLASTLTISGAGLVNNSGITQQLITSPAGGGGVGNITFTGDANAGSSITMTNKGGGPIGMFGAGTTFMDDASAGTVTFINEGGRDSRHAEPGLIQFFGNSTAATGTFTCESGSGGGHFGAFGGNIRFSEESTAADGIFELKGGTIADDEGSSDGGYALFFDTATAGNGVFTVNGSDAQMTGGAYVQFYDDSSAGNATLIAKGGTMDGGEIDFFGDSTGGTARCELFGNGTLSILLAISPAVGSIEGDGIVSLGGPLTVGTNNLGTTFSGLIEDHYISGGGFLSKTGTGTLTLSGANTYTAGTTVTQGTLLLSNQTGSGTGTGAVQVNGGSVGGSGIIAGALTVGTGNAGAVLAPATGSNTQATLTTQSTLTLLSDSTYKCTTKAKGRQVRSDKVVANGVTITAAKFSFRPKISGTLRAGTAFTVISNTSTTPITGTFSNLSDGAIITAGNANFQANYEGGDGNDLTLTVVP